VRGEHGAAGWHDKRWGGRHIDAGRGRGGSVAYWVAVAARSKTGSLSLAASRQRGRRGRAAAWARGRQCGRGGGCVRVRERDWSEIAGGDGGAPGEANERARHRTLDRRFPYKYFSCRDICKYNYSEPRIGQGSRCHYRMRRIGIVCAIHIACWGPLQRRSLLTMDGSLAILGYYQWRGYLNA